MALHCLGVTLTVFWALRLSRLQKPCRTLTSLLSSKAAAGSQLAARHGGSRAHGADSCRCRCCAWSTAQQPARCCACRMRCSSGWQRICSACAAAELFGILPHSLCSALAPLSSSGASSSSNGSSSMSCQPSAAGGDGDAQLTCTTGAPDEHLVRTWCQRATK